jgi:hypothetical protein
MNTTARQITYRATFTESIVGPVLLSLTRSKRKLPLDTLPPGVADYLGLSRPNNSAPWRHTDHDGGLVYWDAFVGLESIKASRKSKRHPPRATVTFSVDRPTIARAAEPLPRTWNDGAKWGVSDWYEKLETAIVAALARGRGAAWTTDWYGSKKEIASACLTCAGGEITAEASVSDDLDTPGHGSVTIPFTRNLDKLRAALDAAHDAAAGDQRENRVYAGFTVGHGDHWEYTLILPAGDGSTYDVPPGDNYHRWGWQEVDDCEDGGEGGDHPAEIPAEVATALKAWADENVYTDKPGTFTAGEWTIRRWED